MDAIKVLVCGDSYMALDYSDDSMNGMHWSRHLGKNFVVTNVARSGSSNTMILDQLQRTISCDQFQAIVLGFTCPFRLEFDENTTSCHPWINRDQSDLDRKYRRLVDLKLESIRNRSIIEYTIMLAKKHAPTVFSLNSFKEFGLHDKWSSQWLIDIVAEDMPMALVGHREFGEYDEKSSEPWASFHVADPDVHLKYAQQVQKCLARQTGSLL